MPDVPERFEGVADGAVSILRGLESANFFSLSHNRLKPSSKPRMCG
jgi:hypothetical protein